MTRSPDEPIGELAELFLDQKVVSRPAASRGKKKPRVGVGPPGGRKEEVRFLSLGSL